MGDAAMHAAVRCDAETRAAVRDIYDAYAKRDFDRLAARIGDDIEWVIYAPRRIFPFGGPKRGKRAVLETLGAIAQDYAIAEYVPKIEMVDGDRAAVVSDVVFVQRSSGRSLNFRIADFLRFRDGRLVAFEEFIDTFDVAEQVVGRHLNPAPTD